MFKQVEMKLKNIDEEKLDIMHYITSFVGSNTYKYTMCEIFTLKEYLSHIKTTECYFLLEILSINQIKFISWALDLLEVEEECVNNTLRNIRRGLIGYPLPY